MKSFVKFKLLFLFLTAVLLAFPSCGGQKEQPVQDAKGHGVVPAAFEDYCTDCHKGSRALGRAREIDQWQAVTRKMSQIRQQRTGEGIPEEVQEEIIEFLMKESSK